MKPRCLDGAAQNGGFNGLPVEIDRCFCVCVLAEVQRCAVGIHICPADKNAIQICGHAVLYPSDLTYGFLPCSCRWQRRQSECLVFGIQNFLKGVFLIRGLPVISIFSISGKSKRVVLVPFPESCNTGICDCVGKYLMKLEIKNIRYQLLFCETLPKRLLGCIAKKGIGGNKAERSAGG